MVNPSQTLLSFSRLRVVPVLVVDGDVEHGVDVGDGHVEEPVPVRRHRLVGRVRLHAVVVQLEHHERVRTAAQVRGVQPWNNERLRGKKFNAID